MRRSTEHSALFRNKQTSFRASAGLVYLTSAVAGSGAVDTQHVGALLVVAGSGRGALHPVSFFSHHDAKDGKGLRGDRSAGRLPRQIPRPPHLPSTWIAGRPHRYLIFQTSRLFFQHLPVPCSTNYLVLIRFTNLHNMTADVSFPHIDLLPLLLSAFLVWLAGIAGYRVFFHPLANIPRPLLAKLTHFYIFFFNVGGPGRLYL